MNRLLCPMLNEAALAVSEGIASAAGIALLAQMVAKGHVGRKSARGFYTYALPRIEQETKP